MKILVVGGGSIGTRHVQVLTALGKVSCSLCDPVLEKRKKARKEFDLERILSDYDEIDLSEFDAVLICTPPWFHVPQALKAYQAGCHVLTEKPLGMTSDGVDELIKVSKKGDKVVGIAFPLRASDSIRRCKELIADGAIGQVRMAHLRWGQDILKYRPDFYNLYYVDEEKGGGVLQDFFPHPLNAMEWILGPEKEVFCVRERLGIPGIRTDDSCILIVRYQRDNVLADFDMAIYRSDYFWEMTFIGTEGTLIWNFANFQVKRYDKKSDQWFAETFDESWDEFFYRNDQNFLDTIAGKETLHTTIEDGWQTLKAVLAGLRSAQTGRFESVD